MFCEKCGTKISADAKFCRSCGAKVEAANNNNNALGQYGKETTRKISWPVFFAGIVSVICVVVLIVLLFGGFGKSNLVGSWYREDRMDMTTPDFVLYSDGTCKIRGEYGIGKWNVVDGKLKIVSFYGQAAIGGYSVDGRELSYQGDIYINKDPKTINNIGKVCLAIVCGICALVCGGYVIAYGKGEKKEVSVTVCPNCRKRISANAVSCPYCGKNILTGQRGEMRAAKKEEEEILCDKCGAKLFSRLQNCPTCAQRAAREKQAAESTTQMQEEEPKSVTLGENRVQSDGSWICGRCGNTNSPAFRTCTHCGHRKDI